MKQIIINEHVVLSLIQEQFPEYKNFAIHPIKTQGHDHTTFHLGDNLLIRLPNAQCYASKVEKEQEWLPKLAPHLSVIIPKPIALGQPSLNYPFHWSIYQWISGESANNLDKNNLNLNDIALSIAQFLQELESIDIKNGPKPGAHNFYRGASLWKYHKETKNALQKLSYFMDVAPYEQLWFQAIQASLLNPPVWIHGDMAPGNIIVENNQLKAVIDFSGIAVGDPACDLVMAWTYFDEASRIIFKKNLSFDETVWTRAQGWALWKALITLASIQNLESQSAIDQLQILKTIIEDHHFKCYFKITPKNLLIFRLNDHEKIIIQLFHPDHQLHCCYFPIIYFMQHNHKLRLNKHEDAREIAERFIKKLEQALQNKLQLSDSIQDLGKLANYHHNKKNGRDYFSKKYDDHSEILNKYILLHDNYFTFLYNDKDGNIILQISPSYPKRYVRKNKKPPYNNFLYWMKTSYKPQIIRIISKNIAEDWLAQYHQILDIIQNNIH